MTSNHNRFAQVSDHPTSSENGEGSSGSDSDICDPRAAAVAAADESSAEKDGVGPVQPPGRPGRPSPLRIGGGAVDAGGASPSRLQGGRAAGPSLSPARLRVEIPAPSAMEHNASRAAVESGKNRNQGSPERKELSPKSTVFGVRVRV